MSNEELVAEIQAGAIERMGELWEQVAGLVKWKAKQVMTGLDLSGSTPGVEFDDLYQSGYLALVRAVEGYNPDRGAFSTWFMLCLKKAFTEATGYRTTRERNEPLNYAISIDTPLSDDPDSGTLAEVIADPAGEKGLETRDEIMWRQQLHEALEEALDGIPEEYSNVLRRRYYQGQSLLDVATEQGVSVSRIQQKEAKGIRLLRRPRTACRLREFYEFDLYCGTGLGSFKSTGMSIQEKYMILMEERKEREEQRRKEREARKCEKVYPSEYWDVLERAERTAQELIARLTPEEKAQLLEKYGYADT